MITAWFLSDLHLTDIQERRSQVLLRFLSSLVNKDQQITHLFLLGDIFDLWVGSQDFFAKKFEPIVELILKLKEQGVIIHYVEGNHDVHISKFWHEQGIACSVDPVLVSLPIKSELHPTKKIILQIEHGDLINQQDLTYLKYRKFLRSKPMQWLSNSLPGEIIQWIGERASKESRKHSRILRAEQQESLRQMIRTHAVTMAKKNTFDFIISGHMHIRDEFQFESNNKNVTSINLGSWFDAYKVFQIQIKNENIKTAWVEL